MAFQLDWSQQASDDLREVVHYFSFRDPRIARSLATRIIERLEHAVKFPESGRIVPEKNDESIREVFLNPYRLVYHVDKSNGRVCVIRIWHASRGDPEI